MTTRAEEIAAEGPYKVKEFLGRECVVDTDNLILWRSEDKRLSEGVADCMNAAYKQGQQDRWISVEKRLPDPNVEVLVAFENDTVVGTSQWCRVKSPDIMGWLGPAENKGKTITHWMPLPPTPPNP